MAHLLPVLRRMMLEGVPPLDMDISEQREEAREPERGVSCNVFEPFASAFPLGMAEGPLPSLVRCQLIAHIGD